MRLWSVPPLLLALILSFSSVALLCAADTDPGSTFKEAFYAYTRGEELERANKLDEALQKFRFCVSVLEQMQKQSPDFNPAIVEFRLRKSRTAIARVQSLQQPLAGAEAVDPQLPFSVPPPASSVFDPAAVPMRAVPPGSAPSALLPPSGGAPDSSDALIARGMFDGLKDQIRSLRAQLEEQSKLNAELSTRLLQTDAEVLSNRKEVDLWRVKVVELQSQLSQTRQSNDDLQQAVDRMSREKAFDERRIASLESDLSDARADLEVADEHASELFASLEHASKFIEADEAIRKQLIEERTIFAARAADQSEEVAKAGKERDAAIAERDALRLRVEDSNAMTKENRDLTAKLAAAEKQIASLSKDEVARDKVEEGLRGELASMNKTLAAMRDQLKAGQDRIADLEKQLADTSSATALATGAIADENTLLRSIVLRELQEQARRQQARKLVEEELEKLQIKSETLLGNLDALASAETALSPAEKKAVSVPEAIEGSDQSDFTIVKSTPESDLPPDLVARAAEANQLSQEHRYDEARGIYEEIARKAPQSYRAAVNLGIAQRQLGDYERAITAFERALELKTGDPFILTNLGTAEYRAGNLTKAVETLQKAISADEENFFAHYLLGAALKDKGDHDGARREVRKSLSIKPDYAPAVTLAGELGEDFGAISAEKSTQ